MSYIHHGSKSKNTKYVEGVFVLMRYDPMEPLFGIVKEVLLLEKSVLLSLEKYETAI